MNKKIEQAPFEANHQFLKEHKVKFSNGVNRREFLYLAAGGALAAMPFSGCESGLAGSKKTAKQPNIIFIMADDLGYGDLGSYGQKEIKTPNIDELAVEGIRFTDCYAGSTVCAPSRSVLMTGQHTGHTRVRNNMGKTGGTLVVDNGSPQRRVPLEAEDFTVAEVLKQAGYVTGITGKWGLAEPNTDGVPTRQGFDEWLGYLNQRRAHTYYPPYLWRNEEKMMLKANAGGRRGQYSHDMFTEFALDFVRRHKAGPFFLYLPYTIPHAKYEIPSTEPYTDKSWPDDAKVHAAMITRMDADIGRMMSLLKKLAIDEKTLVFFCSDNGAAKRWDGIFDSSGPLRGHKTDLYEGGIRTPMIARWPGKVPAGKTSDAPWYFADVMPTFADIAGATRPSNIDGISILPTLLGRRQRTD
ncbi:MAG: arylsulfatase, partial [Sedimentisphaerales bacterium]